MSRTRSRDSRLGRFVSKATALLHPDTTTTERFDPHFTGDPTDAQIEAVAKVLFDRHDYRGDGRGSGEFNEYPATQTSYRATARAIIEVLR